MLIHAVAMNLCGTRQAGAMQQQSAARALKAAPSARPAMGVSAKPWSRTALFFCTYIIGGCAALACQRGTAACGPTWVLSQRHSYALCVTPKIGCSELLEFVRWLELPSEEYCGLHMSSKLRLEAVEEKCAASLVGTAKANAALDCHIQPWRRARDRPNGTFTGCRDAYGTFRGNGLCIHAPFCCCT
jgi:hypothetical protein